MEKCKFCLSESFVKNGFVRGKQRYKCKDCLKSQVVGDARVSYTLEQKQLAVTMYVNNCGFRRIGHILQIPYQTVSKWVKEAGQILEQKLAEREEESRKINILEMDELFTYVQKKLNKSVYGLLLTETEAILLHFT